QAEDGIRDFHVTGVQTCALPIFPSGWVDGGRRNPCWTHRTVAKARASLTITRTACASVSRSSAQACTSRSPPLHFFSSRSMENEIGRASCRERVARSIGAGGVEQ